MKRCTGRLSRFTSTCRYLAFRSGKVKLAAQHAVQWRLRRLLASNWEPAVRVRHQRVANDVVVSLTTWAPRLPVLPLTLLTIVRQCTVPQRVIVWMADDVLRSVPLGLRSDFEDVGVQFLPCEDTGPHKKWINCRELPGDPIVVLADDDIFYPSDWLESLVTEFRQGCDYTAHRCHQMLANGHTFAPYGEWKKDVLAYGARSHTLFATGGAGAAFRPSWIPDAFYDRTLIHDLCPRADDVWLKCAMLYAGIQVRRTCYYHPILGPVGASAVGLERQNVHLDYNTIQMEQTVRHFGISASRAIGAPMKEG